jgi:hypothetical protein
VDEEEMVLDEEDAAAVLARKSWEVVLTVDRMADVVEDRIDDMVCGSSREMWIEIAVYYCFELRSHRPTF